MASRGVQPGEDLRMRVSVVVVRTDGEHRRGSADVALLRLLLLAMVGVLVALVVANVVHRYLLSWLALRVGGAAMDVLSQRLLALPMTYFYSRRTGDIQRRLAGVYLAAAPVYAGLIRLGARRLRPIFDQLEEAFGRYYSRQVDAVRSARLGCCCPAGRSSAWPSPGGLPPSATPTPSSCWSRSASPSRATTTS